MKKQSWISLVKLFILITVVYLVIIVPYLSTDTAFILGWDMRTIYSSNFENLRTMLTEWKANGTLPFWSWANFLGNDFYSSKLFYFNDFWEYVFAWTSMKYTDAIIWMTYLRFLTAGFAFYAYSHYNNYKEDTCILGSLLFTYSAYLLQIMRDPFFASYVSFLPLYFLSVDRCIKEEKYGFFIFMVFFMFFNSYYLFYMTTLFSVLYFLWKYRSVKGSLKNAFPSILKTIGCYMIGFMISGIIVIPEVLSVLKNSRVGTRSSVLVFQSVVPYLDYLFSLFTPVSMLAYRSSSISNLYLYDSPNHQLIAAYVWCGSAAALIFPQLFKKENDGKANRIIWLIITAFALIPFLNSIMHGFSEPSFRWLINAEFLFLVMILPFLENPARLEHHMLQKTAWILAVLLVATPYLLALLCSVPFAEISKEASLLIPVAVTLLIISFALRRNKRKLLAIISLIELAYVSFFTYYGNPTQSALKKEDADRYPVIMGEKNYYNAWSLSLDPANTLSFYRTYIDPVSVYWSMGTNYNLDANIRGLMAYDSTYLASTNDLVKLDPDHVIDYLPWTFNIQNADIMTLVSTKYAVVSEGTPCPFKNGELIGHFALYEVYQNADYINLGKTYTNIMSYDDYDVSNSSVITQNVICHKEDYEEIKALLGTQSVQCDEAWAGGNNVSASLIAEEPGFAVLSVPYDEGWVVRVNRTTVKTYEVNGGMTGIPVETGKNDIEMQFTPTGLKLGSRVTAAGVISYVIFIIISVQRKKKDGRQA